MPRLMPRHDDYRDMVTTESQSVDAPESARVEGNIPNIHAQLEEELGRVARRVHELASRIDPVLGPETPATNEEDPSGYLGLSPVAQSLQENLNRAKFIRVHLEDLLDRIDL